jgi:hypothetical protein
MSVASTDAAELEPSCVLERVRLPTDSCFTGELSSVLTSLLVSGLGGTGSTSVIKNFGGSAVIASMQFSEKRMFAICRLELLHSTGLPLNSTPYVFVDAIQIIIDFAIKY